MLITSLFSPIATTLRFLCIHINPAIYNWNFTVTSVTSVTLPSEAPSQAHSAHTASAKINCNNCNNCNIVLHVHQSSNILLRLETHCNKCNNCNIGSSSRSRSRFTNAAPSKNTLQQVQQVQQTPPPSSIQLYCWEVAQGCKFVRIAELTPLEKAIERNLHILTVAVRVSFVSHILNTTHPFLFKVQLPNGLTTT
jgi:hypothetical protein